MNLLFLSLFYITSFFENDGVIINDFFKMTEYKNVSNVIVSMSILETGWGKSNYHKIRNNLFSIYLYNKNTKKMEMVFYKTKQDCLNHLLKIFRNKKYSTNKEEFINNLKSKGYAEDPLYISKIKNILKKYKDKIK